ncbi:hypothetical protein DSO57_1019558 [Entomophthora muscae]|uniref:Uncharacterized protein n=1 Tax=Entomophthora muscae TaxID=34485 RepID=A0ACC2RV57_9FUNG|nr:hypothetical protein DSO57_1019558 [Entomophthora muscae]
MRLFSIFSLAISAALAATVAQPNVLSSYMASIEKVENFLDLQNIYKANFTAQDLSLIGAKLMNATALEELIVDEVVSFNVTDLSVTQAEAEDALIAASVASKDLLEKFIQDRLANKTNAEAIDDTKKDIQAIIEALSKIDDFEGKSKAKINEVFNKHPETAIFTQAAVRALPGAFDKEVLDYVNLFFGVANDSSPDVADKLVQAIDYAQTQYDLFPNVYYKKLQKAFAGRKY